MRMSLLLWEVKIPIVGFVVVFVGGIGDEYVSGEENAVSGFVKADLRRWQRLGGRGTENGLVKVQLLRIINRIVKSGSP